MFCRKCGEQLYQGARFCERCGEVYAVPRPPAPPHRYVKADKHSSELAIISLVIGSIAIIIFLVNWLIPFAEVLVGTAGIVFAIMAYQRGDRGAAAIAGMILSILAVGMGGIYWCACMLLCSTMTMF